MGKCNSSSTCAQYETLQKYFWLLRLVRYVLSNLTDKTKIGPETKTGQRLLIASHLRQSNYLAIQHRGVTLCSALYHPQYHVTKCWAETILQSETGTVELL
jgi:hypothetical protein